MKQKISRNSLIIYIVLLILSSTLMSMPGGYIWWYCIMGVFAIPPIIAGSKLYKVFGLIALLIAIALSIQDYQAGKKFRQRLFEKNTNSTQVIQSDSSK